MKVLVVDDSTIDLETVGALLDGTGLDVTLSNNIDDVNTVSPDLIILDLYMPEKSGLEMCVQLKASPDTADTPIIMLSSSYDIVDKENCFNAGAIDYLEKPVGREELINAINTYASLGVMLKASKNIQRDRHDTSTNSDTQH